MLATVFVDGPFQRPAAMDRFDKLVLRAAKKKRHDLINRYGDDGCSKLVNTRKGLQVSPKQKQQRRTPQPLDNKSDYEETILELKKAHKELSTSMHSIESQKKQESLKELQRESSDSDQSDDLDIDALFELAWGNDFSQTTMTSHRSPRSRTKNYRTKPKEAKKIDGDKNDDDDKNNDKEFSKKMRKGTIRKIMKVREQKAQKLNRKASPSCSPVPPTRKTLYLQ